MTTSFPDDADGQALRRIAEDGVDLSIPMPIDYFVAVPDFEMGEQVAKAAQAIGFDTEINQDPESGEWTCYCTKVMLAEYDGVVAAQAELEAIAKPLNSFADGWGTFGNEEPA